MTTSKGRHSEAAHLLVEVVLVLASVLIFRSAWTLMDRYALLSTTPALIVMLVVGVVVTLWAFNQLFGHEKFH